MSLTDFLSPVGNSIIESVAGQHGQAIGHQLRIHQEIEGLPELEGVKLAIIGILEDRGSDNAGAAQSPDLVRKYLYPLFWGDWQASVADLGNIYAGEKLEDSIAALREVCAQLLRRQIVPIILGGSQDLCYGNYRAYDKLEQTVNMVSFFKQQSVYTGRDQFLLDGVELLTEERAPAEDTIIAMFHFDSGSDGLSEEDPVQFGSFPFMAGTDSVWEAKEEEAFSIQFNGEERVVPKWGNGVVLAIY